MKEGRWGRRAMFYGGSCRQFKALPIGAVGPCDAALLGPGEEGLTTGEWGGSALFYGGSCRKFKAQSTDDWR